MPLPRDREHPQNMRSDPIVTLRDLTRPRTIVGMSNRISAYVRSEGGVFGGSRAVIRSAAIAAGLVLAITIPVRADAGLTGVVAASYFPRTVDAGLHSIAHQRTLEISACPTCMNHSLMRAGTAEVLAFNFGSGDPVGAAVSGWRSSAVHNGILSNASYGRIGCAQADVAGVSYFACVLAAGPLPAAPAPAPAPPAPAVPAPGSPGGGAVAGVQPAAGVQPGAAALPDTSTPLATHAGGTRASMA